MAHRDVVRRTAGAGLVLAVLTQLGMAVTGGAALAAPAGPAAPAVPAPPSDEAPRDATVPGRYIVVLKDVRATPSETRAAATALSRSHGGTVRKVYTAALRGYSAQLTAAQATRLAADPDVASVEPVRRYHTTGTQTNPPSWGLDRIDQATPLPSGSYVYPTSASGVTAYVIDTGINVAHQDFGGRAVYGYDAVDGDAVADDCNGHGTHVAGTLGGTTYGVAKGVKLVSVRVLDCQGAGSTEGVLAGVDWVTANAAKPAVANMSLSTELGGDDALDQAVSASIGSGVSYSVAAGNDSGHSCYYSPARIPGAITVGATDRVDLRASFSNWGPCLDIYAPGVGITSASIGSTTAKATLNGTSMASPHAAGAAALLLAQHPTWTPAQVRDEIVKTGVAGAVLGPVESMDRLLHVGARVTTRSGVGLRARINDGGVRVAVEPLQPLFAISYFMYHENTFDIVSAGGGLVALKAKANGRYVTADGAGTKPLLPRAPAIGSWEKFQLVDNADGSISLKAQVNGKYVTADSAGAKPLIARATAIGSWEKFDLDVPGTVVSLKASANGKFVAADGAGTKPLIARSAAVGSWEKFELVDRRYQSIALRALVNDRYVTAESAALKPLIARGTWVGDWERFHLVRHNEDGTVFIASELHDGRRTVTAESGGLKPLIANRTLDPGSPTLGLGSWEKFTLSPA